MFRTLAIVVLALFAALRPAAAQTAEPDQAALTVKAEAALRGIEVMRSDFVFSNQGGAHKGRLFVDRAGGRLRMEFDPPLGHLLIANGGRIDFIGGNGTVVSAGVQATPLALVFGPDAKLAGAVEVLEAKARGKSVYIAVAQRDRREDGQVILQFDRSAPDWTLSGWGYLDAEGRYTRTALANMRHGGDLDAALFEAPARQ